MSLYDVLESEGFGEPESKARPRAKPVNDTRRIGDRPYDMVNALDTVEILNWCGIEHEPSPRGEMATCPGCGEPGALVCRDGGIKCLHERCSGEGKSGFRTNVDLTSKVRGIGEWDAVLALADWKGIVVGQPKPADDRIPTDADAPPKEQRTDAAEYLGFWASDLGDMCAEPEREVWLLRDEITGKPALPISRVALLAASGGTGKTTSLAQLAVAAVLGVSWCGFKVETQGRVVLACGESDTKLMHRHLWRTCNALSLSRNDRASAMGQILALPLAGHEVNMLHGSGNELERTEFLDLFRKRLDKLATDDDFGWSLIILDPLSRFAGPDTEKDNSAATKFAQAVESLCTLPGMPAVIVAHHSSKNSIRAGSNDARGVSGIRDAFRTVMLMTKCVTDNGLVGVELRCDKANEAPEFATRWLVRQGREPLPGGDWLDVGGALRLASETDAAVLEAAAGTRAGATPEQREGQKIERTKSKHQARLDALVSVIPFEPEYVSQSDAEIRLRTTGHSLSPVTIKSTLAWLASPAGGSRVVDLSDGSRGNPRQWARPGVTP